MNKEISLFLASPDEQKFLAMLAEVNCELDRSSDRQWFLQVDGVRIQFLRCQEDESSITLGRVAVRTPANVDATNVADLFRSIESWVTNNCVNNLTCRNTTKKGSTTTIDDVWVGPSAKAMADSDSTTLRQSRTGNVVFEFRA